MPENFTYLSSFRDPDTGRWLPLEIRQKLEKRSLPIQEQPNSDFNDVIKTDGVSIAFGMGHHDSAYQFYEDVLKRNGKSRRCYLDRALLRWECRSACALKYNAPKPSSTMQRYSLYPAGLSIFSAKNIAAIEGQG